MTIGKGRLEAFSDGVIAILITIMVLEFKLPHGTDLHHHLFHVVQRISGSVLAGFAYFLLTRRLLALHERGSTLVAAVGNQKKERASVALYALAISIAYWHPWIAYSFYLVVAIVWLAPDPRIERA